MRSKRSRAAALAMAGLLTLGSAGAVACDSEDAADVREGVRDVGDGIEKGAEEMEDQFDQNVDTDGKDDNADY
jgi:hypothetical protein